MQLIDYRNLMVIFSLLIPGSAAAQLTQQPVLAEAFIKLGYPVCLMIMPGAAKHAI